MNEENREQNQEENQEIDQSELKEWKEEAEKYKEALQRTAADLDNLKKRMEKMKRETTKLAEAQAAANFLEVYDDLKRAKQAAIEDEDEHVLEGLNAVIKKFEKVAADMGVEKIEPHPGDQFDPTEHEAISSEKSEKINEDHIIETFETGLRLPDRVIQPAKVRVSKGNN